MKTINLLIGKIRLWLVMRNITIQKTESDAIVSGFDNLKPEQGAMVQSLNSRSAGGFIKNLRLVMISGFDWFMSKFYAGYGHKSIADCGSTTIAIDNISMLGAKAIQDWQLYNGQETSTRYIDVTGLGYIDPIKNTRSGAIMKSWFRFYKEALPELILHLKMKHVKKENEAMDKWETAIEKRSYDILGAFLPAGTYTNASIHMTLRQFDDKLSWMMYHPLEEVSGIAETMLSVLKQKYPSTFTKKKIYEKNELYRKNFMRNKYYVNPKEKGTDIFNYLFDENQSVILHKNFLNMDFLNRYKETVEERPKGAELPRIINQCGSFRTEFLIDFRSYRDLQRQRSAIQEMPLLTMNLGFEKWYLEQLPDRLRNKAESLIALNKEEIFAITKDPFVAQYFIPMGFRVFNTFTVSLADLVYIIELRTTTTVHPTARLVAKKFNHHVAKILPKWFKIFDDTTDDDFDIKRANQDIFVEGKSFSKM